MVYVSVGVVGVGAATKGKTGHYWDRKFLIRHVLNQNTNRVRLNCLVRPALWTHGNVSRLSRESKCRPVHTHVVFRHGCDAAGLFQLVVWLDAKCQSNGQENQKDHWVFVFDAAICEYHHNAHDLLTMICFTSRCGKRQIESPRSRRDVGYPVRKAGQCWPHYAQWKFRLALQSVSNAGSTRESEQPINKVVGACPSLSFLQQKAHYWWSYFCWKRRKPAMNFFNILHLIAL